MAHSPSQEWEDVPGPRILKRRAVDTREAGEPEEAEAVTGFDKKPMAGGELFAPNVPNGHRLTKDPDAKKPKSKAVSSKDAENKSVSSAAKK